MRCNLFITFVLFKVRHRRQGVFGSERKKDAAMLLTFNEEMAVAAYIQYREKLGLPLRRKDIRPFVIVSIFFSHFLYLGYEINFSYLLHLINRIIFVIFILWEIINIFIYICFDYDNLILII